MRTEAQKRADAKYRASPKGKKKKAALAMARRARLKLENKSMKKDKTEPLGEIANQVKRSSCGAVSVADVLMAEGSKEKMDELRIKYMKSQVPTVELAHEHHAGKTCNNDCPNYRAVSCPVHDEKIGCRVGKSFADPKFVESHLHDKIEQPSLQLAIFQMKKLIDHARDDVAFTFKYHALHQLQITIVKGYEYALEILERNSKKEEK